MQPWETTATEKARAEILGALRNSEEAVSGQALSQQLGIGRNSVWKHVQALRQMGYEIVGRTRQGYRLLSVPDTPYPYEIAHELRTHTLGRYAIYLPVTGSTNDVLRDLAKQGAPEGLVVVADAQVSGRGRRGRVWESPVGGGLWVSVLLRPSLMTAQAPLFGPFGSGRRGSGSSKRNRIGCAGQMAQRCNDRRAQSLRYSGRDVRRSGSDSSSDHRHRLERQPEKRPATGGGSCLSDLRFGGVRCSRLARRAFAFDPT